MPGIASSAHFDRSQPRKPRGSSMTYVPIPPQDGEGDDEEAAALSGDSGEEVQEPSQGKQLPPEAQGEFHAGPLGSCRGVTISLPPNTLLSLLSLRHTLPF